MTRSSSSERCDSNRQAARMRRSSGESGTSRLPAFVFGPPNSPSGVAERETRIERSPTSPQRQRPHLAQPQTGERHQAEGGLPARRRRSVEQRLHLDGIEDADLLGVLRRGALRPSEAVDAGSASPAPAGRRGRRVRGRAGRRPSASTPSTPASSAAPRSRSRSRPERASRDRGEVAVEQRPLMLQRCAPRSGGDPCQSRKTAATVESFLRRDPAFAQSGEERLALALRRRSSPSRRGLHRPLPVIGQL